MTLGSGGTTQQVADVLERYFVSLRKDEGYVVDGVDSDELARLVLDALQLVTTGRGTPTQQVMAQAIWQTYAVETGRALPAGLADKLAQAAIDALTTEGCP